MPHVASAVKNSLTLIAVSFIDANFFALLLYHLQNFFSFGIEDLWIKFGTGTNTKYIQVHTLDNVLGVKVSQMILTAHIEKMSPGIFHFNKLRNI